MKQLLFSESFLDPAAHRRNDVQWLKEAWKRSRVILIDPESGYSSITGIPPRLAYVSPTAAPNDEGLFLGGEEQPYFAVMTALADGADLRTIASELSGFDAEVWSRALGLARWHADHQFDFATGQPTTISAGGWERRAGDRVLWPRTDPAIMVLITDGRDHCLLGNGVGWPEDRYSCLAGFVEPGESAENAVRRESAEEVGVNVSDIRYVASQPWPFPRSLMLGFEAIADVSTPIVVQADEIRQARWFSRDEVRAALAGEPAPLMPPRNASISRFLLSRWAEQLD